MTCIGWRLSGCNVLQRAEIRLQHNSPSKDQSTAPNTHAMDSVQIVQMSESDPDMAAAAAVPVLAFGDTDPINLLMEPEPRAPTDVRKRRAGVRLRCQLAASRSVAFKAMRGDEVVGVAMWNPPGYRFPDTFRLDDLPEDEQVREAFEGVDLDYLVEFEHALQEARDRLGIEAW